MDFHIFTESAAPSEVPPGATRPLCPLGTPLNLFELIGVAIIL